MRWFQPRANGWMGVLLSSYFSFACSTESRVENAITAAPAPKHHVIVLGIDGLGSHNLWRGIENAVAPPQTPNLDALLAGGAWSKRAKIDLLNYSGPNWMGMITSSESAHHGVITNGCEQGHGLETIFQVLRRAKPEIGISVVHEWESIACYPEVGSVTSFFKTESTVTTVKAIIKTLRDSRPDFIFTDFDAVDAAGHRSGGSSYDYKAAVEGVDQGIGQILATLTELGLAERTHLIVLADHGHEADGGGHSDNEHPVPFIVHGPGVRPGEISEEVANNQLAQLVAHLFKVGPSPDWQAPLAPFDRYVAP